MSLAAAAVAEVEVEVEVEEVESCQRRVRKGDHRQSFFEKWSGKSVQKLHVSCCHCPPATIFQINTEFKF
jgi:hypothetical protein